MKKFATLGVLLLTGCGLVGLETASVQASDGHTLLTVGNRRVELDFEGRATATQTRNGWSVPDAAQVKTDAYLVNLQDASGTTRWKVKLQRKVKIFQGEEQVVCEISPEGRGRYRVQRPDGIEFGQVRLSGGTARVQDAAGMDIGWSRQVTSVAMATMLCTSIPADARAAIIGELALRGR